MKPKSLRACVQRMLPEIETMLVMGTTREDIYTEVCQRYGLDKTTIRNFDTALYRARKTAKKIDNVLHYTDENEEIGQPEPRGIPDKKFFDEVNAFYPKQFNTKYK